MSRVVDETPKVEKPAGSQRPTRLSAEEVERLMAEGLRLRRALEKRIVRQATSQPESAQIRFR